MVTIKDVARASGVSPTTVSHVLNNGSRTVNKQTRERVLHVIKKLDYHPSAVARALVGGRMNTIGLVQASASTEFMVDPYKAPLIRGILDVSLRCNQTLTLFVGANWEDIERSLPIYCDGRVDGLLFTTPPKPSDDAIQALMKAKVPFVLVGEQSDNPDVSTVDIENKAASLMLVHFLIKRGHRRIALFDWSPHNSHSVALRVEGYREALHDAGIAVDDSLIMAGCYNDDLVAERTRTLMSLPAAQLPTAIFAVNDMLAICVMKNLKELGYQIPRDMSVVGFDDRPDASLSNPSLTTIRQFPHMVGERAAEILLDQIQKGAAPGRKDFLPYEFVMRDSVASL